MKGRVRHSTPAKYYGRGDLLEKLQNSGRFNKDTTNKKTVTDYCDFCLPELNEVSISRKNFGLRARGFKFACMKCARKMSNKNSGTLKGLKVLADYKYYYSIKFNNK